MKFVCLVEKLKSTVSGVSKIIPTNPSLPSLSGILIATHDGKITCTATNLEMTIQSDVFGNVESEGVVCVPARILNELCQSIPGQQVTLEMNGQVLKIFTEKFKAEINVLPAEEFPVIKDMFEGAAMTVEAEKFKSALDSVVFAAAQGESQPEISSVLFRHSDNALVLAATDRYRLAEARIEDVGAFDWQDVLLPAKGALEASRLVNLGDGNVEVGFTEQQFWWKRGSVKMSSRVISGQFPAYEAILNTENTTKITLDRLGLLDAIRASAVFARGKGNIRLSFSGGEMQISSGKEMEGESLATISASGEGQWSGSVLLGYRYLLEGLNALSDQEVYLYIAAENSPVRIEGSDGNTYRYVIMPIRE